MFNVFLRSKTIVNRHGELMWSLMEGGTGGELTACAAACIGTLCLHSASPRFRPRPTFSGSWNKEEFARLVESLALGSVGQTTLKNYLGRRNICVKETKAQGKGPWLHALADSDQVLSEVLKFMACWWFVPNNQQSTVRGYFAAIM